MRSNVTRGDLSKRIAIMPCIYENFLDSRKQVSLLRKSKRAWLRSISLESVYPGDKYLSLGRHNSTLINRTLSYTSKEKAIRLSDRNRDRV